MRTWKWRETSPWTKVTSSVTLVQGDVKWDNLNKTVLVLTVHWNHWKLIPKKYIPSYLTKQIHNIESDYDNDYSWIRKADLIWGFMIIALEFPIIYHLRYMDVVKLKKHKYVECNLTIIKYHFAIYYSDHDNHLTITQSLTQSLNSSLTKLLLHSCSPYFFMLLLFLAILELFRYTKFHEFSRICYGLAMFLCSYQQSIWKSSPQSNDTINIKIILYINGCG